MSLRALAEKHLTILSSSRLSQRDNPKGRPSGTNYTIAISAGTEGTDGTVGTAGTLGKDHWQALQAEADRRNAKAKRECLTDNTAAADASRNVRGLWTASARYGDASPAFLPTGEHKYER